MDEKRIAVSADQGMTVLMRRLQGVALRAGSLPPKLATQIRNRLLECIDSLPGALKAVPLNNKGGSALAAKLGVRFEFSKAFLKRATAVFALERDLKTRRRLSHKFASQK